ncbi:ABC transporter ATP-binding protein [Rhizobium oryziradicis]|uniref:Peptide ABC transporter ATP-binding protein n=1 Tax=Rhizobium oryziradicis TaxID=1867956 RepID=A0A1Q8ZSG0_9HYPH|nr:oligopeptide/dipeptide ABC transporter ATP-binding protein [Rhizobium oryziradicis]OLP45017.1 peptide ABC transporter ATP-binding protein [Rhizobium oryziradicis]
MEKAPLLDVRHLTRDYVSRPLLGKTHTQRALDNISLTIDAHEIFGIVGESGCGKSTLARLVMALDRPTSGQVLFDGEDLFSLKDKELKQRRRDFQMVFQDPFGSLDPRQKIGRIIAEPLHVLASKPDKAGIRARVASMLESVGLEASHAARYPHEFSGGQRQRIAIARALITGPRLVVADEAVSALDLSVQAQVLNLLQDLREKRGVTFLFISHNLAVVNSIADRVGVMYRGRLVEQGPAQAVFKQPLHPYTSALTDAELSVDRFGRQARKNLPNRSAETGAGCAFYANCPIAVERCVHERPELHTVALGRTVACHRLDHTAQ